MEPKIKGKAFNYNDTRDRKFYDVFVWMFHPLAKIVFKTQYIGRENVPKTGSLIIASNHRNSYDPGLIAAARVRKIHYMAKLELFNLNKLASWMLRHLNAFPISRGTGDQRSLNYAIRLVEEGKVLGIFPEGTRSKDGEIHRFKAGAFTLAKEAGAEILPVVLDGTKTLIKKNLAFNWGNRITVRVLPPVPAERVAALETHELMQEVHERMCTALGEVRNEKLKVKDQK